MEDGDVFEDERRLSRFYLHHGKARLLPQVPLMVCDARQVPDGIDKMFMALVRLHGPEPPESQGSLGESVVTESSKGTAASAVSGVRTLEYYRARLACIYKRHNPTVPRVDSILASYAGREEALLAALQQKYGDDPLETTHGSEALAKSGAGRLPSARSFDSDTRALRVGIMERLRCIAADADRTALGARFEALQRNACLRRLVACRPEYQAQAALPQQQQQQDHAHRPGHYSPVAQPHRHLPAAPTMQHPTHVWDTTVAMHLRQQVRDADHKARQRTREAAVVRKSMVALLHENKALWRRDAENQRRVAVADAKAESCANLAATAVVAAAAASGAKSPEKPQKRKKTKRPPTEIHVHHYHDGPQAPRWHDSLTRDLDTQREARHRAAQVRAAQEVDAMMVSL